MILAPKVPNKPNAGRVDFQMVEFRRLIESKGLRMLWSQSSECPCRNNTTVDFAEFNLENFDDINVKAGNPQDCPTCNGSGIITHSPQEIKALLTRSEEESPGDLGSYDEYRKEIAKITLLPEHLPLISDLFTLLDSHIAFKETIEMKAGLVQRLRYKIASRTMELAAGTTTVGVLFLQPTDANGRGILNGDLIENTDFTVDADGNLDFTICDPAKLPAEGSTFSVSYYINPRYKVVGSPHTIRDTRILKKQATDSHEPMLVQCSVELDIWNIENHSTTTGGI